MSVKDNIENQTKKIKKFFGLLGPGLTTGLLMTILRVLLPILKQELSLVMVNYGQLFICFHL
ncbi:hypothetical protein PMI13_02270 [Chryseobacterium populi]|uniref:Uncharacterized protein n=1 Tax=Chryseobacterium populi TaxID=1144316 RepID=J3CHP6_9FLAO|nr:hypothetical protein PMI13_02270 [Chryseobacterium populi]